MPTSRHDKKSLEPSKPISFGATLREAILAEFGTNQAFALHLGISKGRVSQIISGPEAIGHETLERVLNGFSSSSWQQRIQAAWLREFIRVENHSESLALDEILLKIHQLNAEGLPLKALEFAQEQRRSVGDLESWTALTVQIIQTSLRLTQVAKASANILELERRAKEFNDAELIFASRWLKGLVLQAISTTKASELYKFHTETLQYGEAHLGIDGTANDNWLKGIAALERDIAIFLIKRYEAGEIGIHGLQSALPHIERSILLGADENFTIYGLEAKARYLAAVGKTTAADDTLEELDNIGLPEGSELWEKSQLTHAKILESRGEAREALRLYRAISLQALEKMNLHHHHLAELRASLLLLDP